MPVYTIEVIKKQGKSPLKCILHGKVLKIVDMDTYVIGDGTGIIVLDSSKHPKLAQQISKMEYIKIFAPVFENGKLTTASFTSVASAHPIPIVEDPDLSLYVSTLSYNTVLDTRNLKSPDRVNMILKFITKTAPVQQKYSLAVFATALDPAGNEIDVTMYTNKWGEVEIGQTYLCHNLQIDNYKGKGVNQLRTLALTTFMEAPENLKIGHTEDLSKRTVGHLVSYNQIRYYQSCSKCHRSLSTMVNEVCPNEKCNAIIESEDKVNDFTVTFVFDEDDEAKEFEHVQCFMRSLGAALPKFDEEKDLPPLLDALLERQINVKFSHKKNSDGLRVIDKISFNNQI